MPSLRPASFEDIAPFRSAAQRDHVSVSVTRDTRWFLYEESGVTLGYCALMTLRTGARIKGVWVRPEVRGRGHGMKMTKALIDFAVDEICAPRLEVYAHNPKFYEAIGWTRLYNKLHNGAVRLARNY
jgi:ribosomal protein S18 acetylase RimI-like enzyme